MRRRVGSHPPPPQVDSTFISHPRRPEQNFGTSTVKEHLQDPIGQIKPSASGPQAEVELEFLSEPNSATDNLLASVPTEELEDTPILLPSTSNSYWLRAHQYLPAPLDGLAISLISLLGQLGLAIYEMALGMMSWWNGKEDSSFASGSGSGAGKGRAEEVRGEKKKVKRRRRKVEEIGDAHIAPLEGYYPGMVNLSGTLCYMNSVLQAFASITSLVNHLGKIVELAVEVDIPTPVTDSLLDVIQDLNTPQSRPPPALRPHNLLHALHPLPAIRRLLSTREQQDAHELFLVLAEAVSDEAVKVAGEIAKIRGIGEILTLQNYLSEKANGGTNNISKYGMAGRADKEGAKRRIKIRGISQPWEGLMARRRTCQTCGWSETVRMDTLGGMELPIPLHGDVRLDQCIAEYLAPEHLSEVTCEMCSLRNTIKFYSSEVERLSTPSSSIVNQINSKKKLDDQPSIASGSFSTLDGLSTTIAPTSTGTANAADDKMTNSRKKRARDARRAESLLREMLESSTISHFGDPLITPSTHSESKVAGQGSAPISVKWQITRTNSIRQGIVTRPPQSLRLLFIRSEFTPYGAVLKKTARVAFPIFLDLTPFTAKGVWEERGTVNTMLKQAQADGRIDTDEKSTGPTIQKTTWYRLESVILHYGYTHSSGHFICIRRKPASPPTSFSSTSSTSGAFRPTSTNKACPDGCTCENCILFGPARDVDHVPVPGRGWLRISDDEVEEVGEEALYDARGAVFMLFYEKVGEYQGKQVNGSV